MSLEKAVATARRRKLTGTYWHQGATKRPLIACANPAIGSGRNHRLGEPGVWYASNREQGAWAELFRHFPDEGVDPFEVRRRVGRVSVDLQTLDLRDRETRSHLDVDEADLVSEDCATTQAIAAPARDAGFDGVLLITLGQFGAQAIRRRR